MSPIVELIIAILLPTAAGYAIVAALRGRSQLAEIFRRRAHARGGPAESTDRLAANLRRLRAELEDIEARQGLLAKNHRVRALRGAYLDALRTACDRLEVSPPPDGDRVRLADIYRTEAALRQRGLDVRETAAR